MERTRAHTHTRLNSPIDKNGDERVTFSHETFVREKAPPPVRCTNSLSRICTRSLQNRSRTSGSVRTDRPWISRYSMTDEHTVHAYPDYSRSWHRKFCFETKAESPTYPSPTFFPRISKVTSGVVDPRRDSTLVVRGLYTLFRFSPKGKICCVIFQSRVRFQES